MYPTIPGGGDDDGGDDDDYFDEFGDGDDNGGDGGFFRMLIEVHLHFKDLKSRQFPLFSQYITSAVSCTHAGVSSSACN